MVELRKGDYGYGGNSNKEGTREIEESRNTDMVGKSGSFRVVKIL